MTSTPTTDSYESWIGSTAYDATGSKLGKITNVYYDDVTGRPEWMTVSTGWFGTKEQFVPISGTQHVEDGLRVAHTEDHIKDAPSVDADEDHLTVDDERRLYAHYGVNYDEPDAAALFGDAGRADEGFEAHDLRDRHDCDAPTDDDGRPRLRVHRYVIATTSRS